MFYNKFFHFIWFYKHFGFISGVLLFFVNLTTLTAQTYVITGKVTDTKGEALPYATVRIPEQNKGTIADLQGNFRIESNKQNVSMEIRYVGYYMKKENVTGSVSVPLHISLVEQEYSVEETVITSDGKDPAYGIIKKAQEKRKYHLSKPDAWQCEVYIKGLQRLEDFPDRIFGMKTTLDSSNLGIVYLSESVSSLYFRKPKDIREIMISSKVSGKNNAFSYNQASDVLVNFYESLIDLYELSERGFISPIAPSAFLYYQYKLLGKTEEEGETVYRIKVIPKRSSDPVFAGEIFISSPSYRIQATELYLTKEANIEFVDTLKISQVFIPAGDSTWMIGSQRFDFVFSAMGFKGNGNYITNFFQYEINPVFPKGFFGKEILKINEDANLRDSAYWDSIRPIPLTQEEITDYAEKDSIARLREDPVYLDSIDRAKNKFKPVRTLALGHSWYRRRTKTSYTFSPVLTGIQFNTSEGWVLNNTFSMYRKLKTEKYLALDVSGRYGFASGRPHAKAGIYYLWNRKTNSRMGFVAGQWVQQFDGENPVPVLLNSLYSLLDEQNYLKIYQTRFALFTIARDVANGVYLKFNTSYHMREALLNNTYQVFRDVPHRVYTSNDPLNPIGNSHAFNPHNAWIQDMEAKITFANTYISRPEVKLNQGSKWPVLTLGWTGAIPLQAGDASFHKFRAYLQDDLNFRMLGRSTWKAGAGYFADRSQIYFPDYQHFQGNEMFIRKSGDLSFQALPYYEFSTQEYYITAHYVHHFGGFFLNKIPLLRKLKLGEYAGVNMLHVPGKSEWIEYIAGIERLGMQLGFVTAFNGSTHAYTGFRIGSRF